MRAADLLPLIDPKNSEKFSPNLYAWMKKDFFSDANIVVTVPDEFQQQFVGAFSYNDGWMRASRLNGVLCNGSKEKMWAVRPQLFPGGVDATFWDRYIRDGRCAIDPAHKVGFVGDENRWLESQGGKVRECQWCNNYIQVRLDWAEVSHKTAWVPV